MSERSDAGIFPEVFRQEDGRLIVVDPKTVVQVHADVQQISGLLLQMGAMMSTMQKRMDELEARTAKATARHADVLRIQQLIRMRTGEICGKYRLEDAESVKKIRAAIKKDVLKRWGVKDLHDLPEAALPAVENAIGGWVNIRLVMERRGRA